MHYLDTNVIVYSVVNQDPAKMKVSQSIIRELFEKDKLSISPLNLQELIFTLSKLKINIEIIGQTYSFFQQFCQNEIDKALVDSAFEIVSKLNFGKNSIFHSTRFLSTGRPLFPKSGIFSLDGRGLIDFASESRRMSRSESEISICLKSGRFPVFRQSSLRTRNRCFSIPLSRFLSHRTY